MGLFTGLAIGGALASGLFAGKKLGKKSSTADPVTAPGPAQGPAATTPPAPPVVNQSADLEQAQAAGAKQRKRAALGSSLRDRPLPKPGQVATKLKQKTLTGY